MQMDKTHKVDLRPPSLIVRNFFVLSGGTFVVRTVGLVTTVYLARVLGSAAFGDISFALAIVFWFTVLGFAGIDLFGTRELARREGRLDGFAGNIVAVRLVSFLFCYAILSVLAYVLLSFKDKDTGILLLILGVQLLVFAFSLDWVFEGIQSMGYVSLKRVLHQLMYVSAIFIFITSSKDLLLVSILYIAAALTSAVIILMLAYKMGRIPKLRLELSVWRSIIKDSLPMTVSVLAILTYVTTDQVMLWFMRGSEDVGYYVAAFRLIAISVFMPILLMKAFFPQLSKEYALHQGKPLRNLIGQYANSMSLVGFPIAVGGIFLSDEIVRTVYGHAYLDSVLPLRILWLSSIFATIGMIYGQPLLAWDRQGTYMKVVMVAAVVNIGLNGLLIPVYGPAGAATATVITNVLVASAFYLVTRKLLQGDTLHYSTRPFLACLVMVPLVFLGKSVDLPLVANIMLGGSGYLAAAYFLKALPVRSYREIFQPRNDHSNT